MNPTQKIEINKVSTRESTNKNVKSNNLKKPNPTVSPMKKTSPTKKPSVIKLNNKCSLVNFRLNDGCLSAPGDDHAIDLVGQ